MPWKESTTMSQREQFLSKAIEQNRNMSALCREYEISRKTGYKWLKRYQTEGTKGIADRSRRPKKSPKKISKEITKKVLAVRGTHPAWGGRKIKAYLEQQGHKEIPASSTITRILQRHQKIDPEKSGKHKAYQRFEMEKPNQLWQMDFKGYFSLENGDYCHPLTIIDDHSRFLIGLKACLNEKRMTVQEHLKEIFKQFGLPDRILSDNGPPWGYHDGRARYTVLTVWLLRLGIKISHGRPYHPQTQGKDERLHRTLNEELLSRKSFFDINVCQKNFDDWRTIYNQERPHEAKDMLPPASCYQSSKRSFPEVLPTVIYEPDYILRKVQKNGKFSFNNRTYPIGKAFCGQTIGIKPSPLDGLFDVYYCSEKLLHIDLTLKP